MEFQPNDIVTIIAVIGAVAAMLIGLCKIFERIKAKE